MRFTKDDIRRIKEAAEGRLLDVIGDYRELRQRGKDYVCDCPRCGGKEKLSISPAKGLFKCWSCPDVKGRDAISYLMAVEGMDYLDALDHLARRFNVLLDPPPAPSAKTDAEQMKRGSRAAKGQDPETFCARMLAASGLTYEDVTAKVYKTGDTQSIFEARTFRPGTVDEYGNITEGDDVIIEYYDLDGLPVTYQRKLPSRRKAASERKEYYRVRWQFPQEHLDKEGRPFKYKSPAGSGTPIYIPERIRRMYKGKAQFTRLYIQEGEKKAEKASKHGIPSIAISGIQNLGQKGALPEDLVKIIATCGVTEVALIFDSDWNDLSQNIRINKPVEQRPASFFAAARNFKEYMRMLKNRGILVEVFVGHVQKTESGDKGIDDLLTNLLKGHEDELAKDIEFACNEKSGQGRYVAMHKVTTWNDFKLKELWCLHSHEKFAELHRDVLAELPEFMFGRYAWKFGADGKVVSALPFEEDEKFWIEEEKLDREGNKKKVFEYDYVAARNFFQNRGIGKYRLMDTKYSIFIHLDPPVVETFEVDDARDFMFSFAEQNCSRFVNNALLKGGSQFVGPFQLLRLHFIQPNFIVPSREEQYFYFKESCWRITQTEVKEVGYESVTHHIWAEQRKNVDARYLGSPLITFTEQDGNYTYRLSPDGEHCHYLRFLINASNFTWRKKPEEVEESEVYENNLHLLSKLCAIGYLLMEAKDNNVTRAVVGMDGKQSEVGESNGRSGKSLIGELMRQVVPIAYLPGKKPDLLTDQFVWNDVDEKTRLVFIDDVLQNFNFEFLFPNLTGDWTVNKKGGTRITYPFSKSPKIYIATNHAIRGTGSSFTDRQWLIAFSDFYNDTHKPLDDFGVLFFSEWDFTQWNLCWNLLANCIQLYLTYGVVQAPGERLEQRKLRQEIGELFISWADEYFSSDEHLNHRLVKKELYDALVNYDPKNRDFINPNAFKKKLIAYCRWKGFVFNPQKYDPRSGKPLFYDKDGKAIIDDKSGGVEYVTIGTTPGESPAPASDPMGLPMTDNKLEF